MRSLVHGTSSPPHTGHSTWLLIDAPQALRVIDRMQHRPSVVIARYADLNARLLSRVMPDWLVCPVISIDFDAIELLRRIRRTSWRGTVGVVMTPEMPDSSILQDELQHAAPNHVIRILHP